MSLNSRSGQWLGKLRSAASAVYSTDGISVAIEELRALANYHSVSADAADAEAGIIVVKLRDLADHNESYKSSRLEPEDFHRWSRGTLQRLAVFEMLTAGRRW